jgi:hypothetical protein
VNQLNGNTKENTQVQANMSKVYSLISSVEEVAVAA